MKKETIKELALANGFKLKEQADGSMDLNPYVYQFAAALERLATAELKAQVEQLEQLLVLSTDQNDLLLDEFVRVKLLTNNTEIHALCERAHVRMRQNVSVIDRNMMQEQKIISQKRDIEEMQCHIELLQSFLMQCKYRNPEIEIPVFMRTGQCLAEIKAQAGRDGFVAGLFSEIHNPTTVWNREERADEYANQLRQQAKRE